MAVVAVDIGGTKLLVSVVGLDGEILIKSQKNTPRNTPELIDLVTLLVNEAINRSEEKITGIGLAVAGLVNYGTGTVVFSPNLSLSGVDIAGELNSRLGLPVRVDNDGNLAAWGEKVRGAARDIDNFVGLTLGTGIGGGVFIKGEIYRGYFGTAAEIGHMVVEINGPQCNCGRRGCFEALASGTAVARLAAETAAAKPLSALAISLSSSDAPSLTVEKLASAGDADALAIFNKMGRALGIGLGSLVNIFNPEGIILGGGLAKAADLFLSTARDSMLATAVDPRADRIKLIVSELGHDAVLYGAAALANLQINRK